MQNVELPEEVRFIVILPTADIFIHLGHIYYFLQTHQPRMVTLENGTEIEPPVMFGHAVPSTHVFDYDYLPCGAMILNRPAYDMISMEATKRDCPYVDDVPLTVGFC